MAFHLNRDSLSLLMPSTFNFFLTTSLRILLSNLFSLYVWQHCLGKYTLLIFIKPMQTTEYCSISTPMIKSSPTVCFTYTLLQGILQYTNK